MKWLLAITLILIFALTGPSSLLAKSSVQKLKDPVTKFAEYDLVFEEILSQGEQAVPDLIALLQEKISTADPDEARRHWGAKVSAMNILSEMKAKDALAVLKDMLENSDDLSAVYNAARAIGNIGGNHAYKILEEVFTNAGSFRYAENNQERKKAAITGLGLCENKKAIPYLIAEMNNPNSDEVTRIYAAGSLGLLGVDSGFSVASAGLASDDEYVRMAAVRALGIIGDDSAVPALTDLLDPKIAYVYRKAAKLSIFQIQTGQMTGDEKIGFIRQELMKHPDTTEFVQWGTLKLKKINTPASQKALEDLSALDGPEFIPLKNAARLRSKTMK
jgi:HEAT repeat protein